MTTRLYYVPLPDAQTTSPATRAVSSQIAIQGLLEGGGIATEPIATDGIDITIGGQFRFPERFARKLARELESLGEGSYTDVPLFNDGVEDLGNNRGYYEIDSVDVNPAHETTGLTYEYTVNLAVSGSQSNHWRAVNTRPADVSHPFGNDEAVLIGIHAQARKARWVDVDTGDREPATSTMTRSAEFGDVDLYDVSESSFDEPTLIFELDYEYEGKTDVKVFDDRGGEKFASYQDAEGNAVEINQWAHVFHEGFDYEGSRVVDNGLVRLRFDEPNNKIEAWEWDDGVGEWAEVALGESDYELLDADIRRMGPSTVTAIVEFHNPSVDPTEYYPLRMHLKRGWEWPLWEEIKGEGGTPPGLVDLLDPVASASSYDPGEDQGLRNRSDL